MSERAAGIEIRPGDRLAAGRPILVEGPVWPRVQDIVDRVRAGDSELEVAEDFGVNLESVRLLMEVARAIHPIHACRPLAGSSEEGEEKRSPPQREGESRP